MNERIWELAKQAGINLTPAQFSGVLEDEVDEFTLEDFAKLLIQECAGRVDNILRERKDGGGTMGDAIREHFGLRE